MCGSSVSVGEATNLPRVRHTGSWEPGAKRRMWRLPFVVTMLQSHFDGVTTRRTSVMALALGTATVTLVS